MSAGALSAGKRLATPSVSKRVAPIVVVGGSGFLGCNLADSFLRDGEDVIILDNLSRAGVERNLEWLAGNHGASVHAALIDIRDFAAIEPVFREAKAVFHFAAQTAVTTSLLQPIDDFETNARGTINVLEATRRAGRNAPVILASTNKVYGALADMEMMELDGRYMPTDETTRRFGVSEKRPLDFCTPYGCSKGVADQYVLDYAKSYGLPTAVLRMSCVYGPRQFGTEDQGWVAHFLLSALAGERISIYGDGKQVRDILHVSDAVAAYRAVLGSIDRFKGRAFNLGGGPANAVSVAEVLREIELLLGRPLATMKSEWRAGDQFFFVADTRALREALGWKARMAWRRGLRDLHAWLVEHRVHARAALRQPRRIIA
ncbi:NAD-dependent epimerase/dehydratase family protein [Sinorhizobium numidicum]|uniref:NAD-dependent epimerase/dehydratase family protein n=1 Tax=Sinorhizobium numidicum TaxID=680248 RepID=A0ABY8CZS4_9HYPH|nr:NAD-dependent epimerase/dehydratase family protein [Sinorhizobium numidicum]WEX77491.1 NAD-dependent epimerase/dehydratase family protein [Sinorhizobium numidicum]WEX84151.1 NAD-dependent epimerase/dehydratase family protein [Sinorhizobium numidicum]